MTDSDGSKIVLHRRKDLFWNTMQVEYAEKNPLRWRNLAITHLYTYCGWDIIKIGKAFDLNKGTVFRIIEKTKKELKELFVLEDQ